VALVTVGLSVTKNSSTVTASPATMSMAPGSGQVITWSLSTSGWTITNVTIGSGTVANGQGSIPWPSANGNPQSVNSSIWTVPDTATGNSSAITFPYTISISSANKALLHHDPEIVNSPTGTTNEDPSIISSPPGTSR